MAVCAVSGALQGVDAVPIMVEVDLLRRLPSVAVVGLAAHAVKESTERVRSAIASAGFEFPRQRIVINLAPADLRKEGTALDLPIALAILAAQGVLPAPALQHVITAGELSLGGELRPVRGGLPLAILARNENKTLVLPGASAREAAAIPGVEVLRADHLAEVVDFLNGTRTLIQPSAPSAKVRTDGPDLCDVHGQHMARRALEISAAGAHHLLLRGPPGCGKSMLARRLPTILPSMSFDEALAAARIRSAAGLEPATALARTRPFRACLLYTSPSPRD